MGARGEDGTRIQSGDSLHGPKMSSVAVANALGTGSTSGSVEVRVVDPQTGGEKGSKLARYDLIPVEFEEALANHYGKVLKSMRTEIGKEATSGLLAMLLYAVTLLLGYVAKITTQRQVANHLIAVAWHAVALYIFQLRGLGTDDIRRRKEVI
jgi:hypothetical protein